MTSRYRYISPGLARGELAATTRADLQDSGDRARELAEQQAALRRVATLVGRGVSPSEVFAAVADETARCLHADNTSVNRFEGNEVVVVATHLEPRIKDKLVVGQRFPLDGDDIVTRVFRTGRAARMDASESQNAAGAIAANGRDMELGCTMGFPIVVNGRVWGIISVGAHTPEELPPNPQERLSEFAELVTTAIANAAARDALGELAEQQAALRRVATLVARGVSPSEVFAAVAEQLAHCLGVKNAGLFRYESGGAVLVAACEPAPTHWPVGDRRTLEGDNIPALVLRTGRAVRMNSFENAAGSIAARARELGIRGAVGVPIVVDGRLWGGAYVASMTSEPLRSDTEERMTDFAYLVATALANAATRAELRELAEQQAALRRVATLVARGVNPSVVFAAVADEVGRCLNVDNVAVGRFNDDEVAVVALARIDPGVKNPLLVGERSTLDGDNVATRVLRTGRAARLDRSESEGAAGPVAERFREMELG
ncbi:MAG TPA: GAF domain-containing protein, partial [Mycobacterium sp.]|nr:GAF domain-containing protein [Mycobacterium sp.]